MLSKGSLQNVLKCFPTECRIEIGVSSHRVTSSEVYNITVYFLVPKNATNRLKFVKIQINGIKNYTVCYITLEIHS